MNKRQSTAIDRARRAVSALEKVGLSTFVGDSGTFYAVPTKIYQGHGGELGNFALVQDHGDHFGSGTPLSGDL